MNARKKLNVAHLNGALILAALVGSAAGPWAAAAALALALASAVYTGGIRPASRRR